MEGKRRLPVWMLGASAANKTSKPVDLDESNEVSGVAESTKPKVKRVSSSEGKSFLVKCERKRKKGGFDKKYVIESGGCDQEVVVEKRNRRRVERNVEESECLRKAKEEDCEFDSSIVNEDSSCDEEDDDDDDLTMEDLLSIAKEFVEKAKRETSQQRPSKVQCESKIKSSYTSSSVTKTSSVPHQDNTPPIHEGTASHNNSVENTTSQVTLADYRTTDDPAQDMLDLFLGPLLKKPVEKEETTSIKDIIIPNEIKNQQHAAIISKKPVNFTKKKSSLRDAVAMLLD